MEWYGFRAQGIHINGEREKNKSWYYPPPVERWGCTALYSRGQGGISGTAGTSGMRAKQPGLWALHLLLALALFLLRLHLPQDLQFLRDELGRIRSGGASPGGINVGTERETPRVGRENVPHPENAHDGFPTTDLFLFFPFAIFDYPEISL
jgi:hypothetical protein